MAPPSTDGYCVVSDDEQSLISSAPELFDEYRFAAALTKPAIQGIIAELRGIDIHTASNKSFARVTAAAKALEEAQDYAERIEALQNSDGTITGDYESFAGLLSGIETAFAVAYSALGVVAALAGPAAIPAAAAAFAGLKATQEIIDEIASGVEEILNELRHEFPEEADGCGGGDGGGGSGGGTQAPPRLPRDEPDNHQNQDEEQTRSLAQRILDWFDPLVLDLDGDGAELTQIGNPEVFFDFDGDALRQMTGWIDPDDGIVVRDLDDSGQIENGVELFGNAEMDAFTDLAGYDSNQDGVIDQSDDVWSDLKVWRDLNQNGVTDVGEMSSMHAAGVVSISLERETVADIRQGNLVVADGSYTTTTGEKREAIATFLQTDEARTRPDLQDDFEYNPEVFTLPNLTGSGSQFDLHISMTWDPQLLGEVKSLVAAAPMLSGTQFKSSFESVISTWTGVSRSDFTTESDFELAVAQAILGSGAPDAQWPSVQTASYDMLISSLQLRFAAQIGVLAVANAETPEEAQAALQHPFFAMSAFVIDHEEGTITGSLSHAVIMATSLLPRDDRDAAIEQIEKLLPMLNALRGEFFDETFQRIHGASEYEQSVWSVLEATTNDIVLAYIAQDYATAAAIENGTDGDDTISVFHDDFAVEYNRDISVVDAGEGDDTIVHTHETEILASVRAENTAVTSYIYRSGDGNDIIDVTGVGHMVHTVYLPDIAYEEAVIRSGENGTAVIAFPDGGSIGFQGIENDAIQIRFVFEDGRVVTGEDVIAVSGGAENNFIDGTEADDVFDGGAGDDVLSGMGGSDTYHFFNGGGHDEIIEAAEASGTDVLWMRDALVDDISVSFDGGDLTIAAGDDSVTIKDQLTPVGLFGSQAVPRIEVVRFADGQEVYADGLQDMAFRQLVTGGDDVVNGSATGDRLFLSQDDDVLSGRGGADEYIREAGVSGNDVIDDLGGTVGDRLVLKTENRSDVAFSRDGEDIVLTFPDGSTTTLARQMANGGLSAIEEIEFADGETLSAGEFAALINAVSGSDAVLQGTDAGETLTGTAASDTLDGKAGDDMLEGAAGSDLYIRRSGDGNDVIRDNGGSSTIETDRVSFEDLARADVAFRRKQSGDLEIETLATGEILTVEGQFSGSTTTGIEEFIFTDGTIRAVDLLDAPLTGDPGDDVLTGTDDDDEIVGAKGDDTMDGLGGSDVYVISAGDGNDLIDDMAASGDINVLRLQGVNAADISVERLTENVHNDALIRFGENQTVTLAGQFSPTDDTRGVQSIVFDDGTVIDRETLKSMARVVGTNADDELLGSVEDDIIVGLEGDDTLSGLSGDDVYRWSAGDGNDVILDGAFSDMRTANTVEFIGIDLADVIITRDGDHLVVESPTGETLTLHGQFDTGFDGSVKGVGALVFADGETLNRADLIEMFPITGTDADDRLDGSASDDALLAGLGNDVVDGGRGSDTVLWRKGDGSDLVFDNGHESTAVDSIKFVDVASDAVAYARGGFAFTDLEIHVLETGERVTLGDHFGAGSGIEQIVFVDGVTLDTASIANLPYIGTDSGDYIEAGDSDDTLIGGLGDDTLLGGNGADTYVYAPGDGHDLIDESYEDFFGGGEGGFETELEFEDPDVGDGEIILYNSAGDTLDLTGFEIADVAFVRSSFNADDLIVRSLDDGAEITVAHQFAGTLAGIEHFVFGNGTLSAVDVAGLVAPRDTSGTDGSDILTGDYGDQTFTPGDGDDRIVTGGGADTIVIAPGGGLDFIEGFVGGPFGTVFDLDPALALDFETVMAAAEQVEHDVMIDFGNWDIIILANTRLSDLAPENFGFDPAPITGTEGADDLSGTVLADLIQALDGDDTIDARGGDDTVEAGSGDDTVHHEAGDGNDTYFGGDGQDTIALTGGVATVDLEMGTAVIGEDLISLTGFESVLLGDSNDQVTGNDDHNNLQLGGGDDIAKGGQGLDTLDGGDGNDRLEGGAGNDTILGGEGEDSAVFSGNLADYRISENELGFVVEDLRGDGFDGTDTLHGIESLVFADQTIAVEESTEEPELPVIEGTDGRDRLRGTDDAEHIIGLDGNDSLFGRDGNDVLQGGNGRDFLNGGLGNDAMDGGAGDDIYIVDATGDTVTEMADAGVDMVRAFVSYTLADNIEMLNLKGENAIDGIGNALDNNIYGSSADNHLVGGVGDDRMFGQSGNDLLEGGAGSDVLRGGYGNDVLNGGAGADSLRGGKGADNYVFAAEDGVARDTVFGFKVGSDSISLSGLEVASIADEGAHSLVTFDNGGEVLLRGVDASDLSLADDFTFL